MTSTFPRALSLLALACLASAARAEIPSASVHDNAGLFHADSIAQAEERISELRQNFGRHLIVRTVASASPRQRHLLPFLRTPQVNRLLEAQARKYADEVGQAGIYVVICNHPRDVHVIVRPEDDPEFTRHDAETLRRGMVRRLDDSTPDIALLALVDQAESILQTRLARGGASFTNEMVLGSVLGGGLVLWALLGMIRFKMRARQTGTPHKAEAAMSPRATPALLGAMFGFPAGMWIYDKLYPCPAGTPLPLCEVEAETRSPADEEHREGLLAEDPPRHQHAEDAPVSP